MDWFTWLSKTGLDPSLVYEYGVAFAQNELEHADIPYFNHEFLLSMGISIAKHRLEILKLARKKHNNRPIFPSRILIAIKQTKTRFSDYLRALTRCDDSAALALVPRRRCSSGRWKSSTARNNNSKRLMAINNNNRNCKQMINRAPAPATLLLTNGSPMVFGSSRVNSLASPYLEDEVIRRGFDENDDRKIGDYDEYWSSTVEEIRWDTMFQNLKPT